jgi:hypothetical protein
VYDASCLGQMKPTTRLLWWLGAFVGMCLGIILFLTDWHWHDLYMRASFAVLRPELSGFRSPYPVSEIATNGISPNGEWAFVLGFSTDERTSNPPNCLVKRSAPGQRFDLPSYIEETSDRRQGIDGVVRWAKDSSSVVFFKSMDHPIEGHPVVDRSAYDIYVVPIVNGVPGKPVALETEILKVSHSDFAKAFEKQIAETPYFYSRITDHGLDDNLTFNSSNQLVIDCYCGNDIKNTDSDHSWMKWTDHVTGLWDPIQGKFVQASFGRVGPAH